MWMKGWGGLGGEGTHGDEIAPADPAAEGFVQGSAADPVAPSAFDDAFFEQGPCEEEGGEEEGAGDFEGWDGPPAEETERFGGGGGAEVGDDVDGAEGAEGGGEGDGADAGADDGGGVAGEGG